MSIAYNRLNLFDHVQVHCCRSIEEAKTAFQSLIGKSKYEGGINDAVLVQEYADGEEYAVDTVVGIVAFQRNVFQSILIILIIILA